MTVVELSTIVAHALGVAPSGALLVRPDGVALGAWWSSAHAAAELAHAVPSLVGTASPVEDQVV